MPNRNSTSVEAGTLGTGLDLDLCSLDISALYSQGAPVSGAIPHFEVSPLKGFLGNACDLYEASDQLETADAHQGLANGVSRRESMGDEVGEGSRPFGSPYTLYET